MSQQAFNTIIPALSDHIIFISENKMMTSSENNVMESTALLNQKTNEESTSFKKYLTPKYAIAATATIALGAVSYTHLTLPTILRV